MRRALVTGASSELGQATCRALAADGWGLVATGRDHARLVPLLVDLGAEVILGDLEDVDFRAELAELAKGVDGLVHAASPRFAYARFDTVSEADRLRLRALEEDTPVALLHAALPEMAARRGGTVVLVSSLAASVSGRGAALYGAHKAWVEGLVRGLALDYGRFGVRINAVAPGPIEGARLAERTAMGEAHARLVAATALRRLARPDEVAAVIAFLMSERASFVTGVTVPVTGGLHLNGVW